ncbi:hypothetical protein VCHA29O37_10253 [Vibrio chagasii]|nr:hypothetical protein VCHA29O37_10253 [Vibrio chagasii]
MTLTNAWALGFGLWALGFEKSTEEIEQRTTNLVVHLMTVKQVTLSTAGYYHLFTTLLERGFSY